MDKQLMDELDELLEELHGSMEIPEKIEVLGSLSASCVLSIQEMMMAQLGTGREVGSVMSMGLMVLSVMRTCFQHPEWLQAVVAETNIMGTEESNEERNKDILTWWRVQGGVRDDA